MTDHRLQKMQKLAQRFHETGTIDQLTMRKIDALAMQNSPETMSADQGAEIQAGDQPGSAGGCSQHEP